MKYIGYQTIKKYYKNFLSISWNIQFGVIQLLLSHLRFFTNLLEYDWDFVIFSRKEDDSELFSYLL